MNIQEFNNLELSEAHKALMKCCGSKHWADKVLEYRPFKNREAIGQRADNIWYEFCTTTDWLEAFTHHPKIGGDLKSLEKKFAPTKKWSGDEQSGIQSASRETLVALADGNEAYYKKFGYIFIICATGKSAQEMLNILNTRLPNSKEEEIKIAMGEQAKITQIRLDKLLTSTN